MAYKTRKKRVKKNVPEGVATSSYTPSIVWNSWRTPSILILLIALPGNEDNITLLKALPIVLPKPLSNGSSSNFP